MTGTSHPGELASPQQMLALADEYRLASDALHKQRRMGEPLSLAPFRLTAIHAVELYLNAMLLACGREPAEIRGFGHDLSKRAALALTLGLKLRKGTVQHLDMLIVGREYLVSRYAPEVAGVASLQTNRMLATLKDVAEKTSAIVNAAKTKPRRAPLCR